MMSSWRAVAQDSPRVETVLACEIADGVLKVGASCRPKTSSLRDSRSAPLPFAEPFRILSVAVSSRFKLNLIYLILLSVGFGFIRYLQIQSTWT